MSLSSMESDVRLLIQENSENVWFLYLEGRIEDMNRPMPILVLGKCSDLYYLSHYLNFQRTKNIGYLRSGMPHHISDLWLCFRWQDSRGYHSDLRLWYLHV